MSKRVRTMLGVVFTAVGASVVYVGVYDHYTASADSVVSGDFLGLSLVMILAGAFVLLTGIISLIFVFASSK